MAGKKEAKSAIERSLVPGVPIKLPVERNDDGSYVEVEFLLVFDWNAVALIEEHTGRNLLQNAGWQKLNARDLSVFLWAALLEDDPELTLKEVRRMMFPWNRELIDAKLAEAYKKNFPDPQPEDPPQPATTTS